MSFDTFCNHWASMRLGFWRLLLCTSTECTERGCCRAPDVLEIDAVTELTNTIACSTNVPCTISENKHCSQKWHWPNPQKLLKGHFICGIVSRWMKRIEQLSLVSSKKTLPKQQKLRMRLRQDFWSTSCTPYRAWRQSLHESTSAQSAWHWWTVQWW